ncbi:SNARE domain-containing protein [Plantibacter sp. CFBP 8804]|uniref:SNARE domain-containing protein n=1 Tax=Plantibacter sp. CFBP 8804 TaxID=2775270 RepID=UPI00177FE76C|nr:SNARE domain-containing protein [Plantibacter sp. CFBP 8804]MBD8519138.1 hypothetical protein [Plantibacter sp. CFBP 8804]
MSEAEHTEPEGVSDTTTDEGAGDETSTPWDGEPDLFGILAETVGELQQNVDTLRGTAGTLQETIERHEGRLDDLDEMLQAIPDGPWAWHMLNTPERRKLWERLYGWVAWLEDRYLRNLSGSRTGVFPADWYRHPVAVELLTALMVAHTSAYRRKASAPSFALVEWHERCLWPTLDRMSRLGLFPTDTETSNWDGPQLRPTRRDDDRFASFLTADLAAATGTDTPAIEEMAVPEAD